MVEAFLFNSDFDVPLTFPGGPPGAVTAEAIFRHFKCSFEKFENWHLRQRSIALKSKHDLSMDALHKELRDSKGASLQLLDYRHEYTVELVDVSAGDTVLDREISLGGLPPGFLRARSLPQLQLMDFLLGFHLICLGWLDLP